MSTDSGLQGLQGPLTRVPPPPILALENCTFLLTLPLRDSGDTRAKKVLYY